MRNPTSKLEADLSSAKKGKIAKSVKKAFQANNGIWVFPSEKHRQAKVAEITAQLEKSRASKLVYPGLPYLPAEASIGDVGKLGIFTMKQVAGPKAGLIEIDGNLMFLSDIKTENLIDGRNFWAEFPVKALKTHTYTTAAGSSNTVPFVTPLADTEIKAFRDAFIKVHGKPMRDAEGFDIEQRTARPVPQPLLTQLSILSERLGQADSREML